jgi:hypothetical protein
MHFSFVSKNRPMVKNRHRMRAKTKKSGGVCFGGSVAHLRTEPHSSGQMSLGFFALLAQTTVHGTRRVIAMVEMQKWVAGMAGV